MNSVTVGIQTVLLLCIAATCLSDIESDKVKCRPHQVHIALSDSVSEMIVMWSTYAECTSEVRYGPGPWGMSITATAVSKQMTYTDNLLQPTFLYRAILTDLSAGTMYHYMPVSNEYSSGPFYFETMPDGQAWQPQFMVYGDLGIHSKSMAHLTIDAMQGIYSAVLHVGDFGYNLYDTVGEGQYKGQNVGDVFMKEIESFAAYVPYMVSPGNHEIQEDDSFHQYRYRFSMPNTDWPIPLNKMWYSFDVGPIHFLSYSSEVFFLKDKRYIESQQHWITADLIAANKNRHTTPWIVAFGHRPMYCSNSDGDDCTTNSSLVRLGLEELFYNQGMDMVIQAHEHSYERLWPMYKGVVLSHNYTEPTAPIQVVTGAAGSKHGVDPMKAVNESWSAFRMDNTSFNSYGRLKVYNTSHLYWEQVSVFGGHILDSMWVTQNTHGPFSQASLPEDQKEEIDHKIKEDKETKTRLLPKPETTGDSITEKVTKAIKGADIKLVIGVSFGVFGVLFLFIVCIVKRCRKRPKSYRRWETLDYGKKFYSTVKGDEKEADDFEVDVTDGTTKLIDSTKD